MNQYAIATKEMDQIMSRLHRLFDIRITYFDVQEHEWAYFNAKPMARFCLAQRRRKEQAAQCALCDKTHLEEARKLRDVLIYRCYNGLIEGAVPLYDRKGIYLGAIAFGQLRDPERPPGADWSPVFKRLYQELPAYSFEKALDVGHLLKCVSESIINNELIRYRNKAWAEKLTAYIETHLCEKITNEQLAQAVGRSASFVAHHFESEFGRTPRQYILERRMGRAKIMLESGVSVQKAADQLGFYDAFHFSKTFKRFWKHPPIFYRSTADSGGS